jgi:hypothetical protein
MPSAAPYVAEGVPRAVPGGSVLVGEVAAPVIAGAGGAAAADPSILRTTSLNNSGLVPAHYYKANQMQPAWHNYVDENGIHAGSTGGFKTGSAWSLPKGW